MWFFRGIKFSIKLFFILIIVSVITFILVTKDEISENGLFLKNNIGNDEIVKEKLSTKKNNELFEKVSNFNIYDNSMKELEKMLTVNIDRVDDRMKRKLLIIYTEKLNELLEIEKIYLDTYELELIDYLKLGNNLKEESIQNVDKGYFKEYLLRLNEENLMIVKTNYVERFELEINYTNLINNFEGKIPDEIITEWKSIRKESLQSTIRSKKLYK